MDGNAYPESSVEAQDTVQKDAEGPFGKMLCFKTEFADRLRRVRKRVNRRVAGEPTDVLNNTSFSHEYLPEFYQESSTL